MDHVDLFVHDAQARSCSTTTGAGAELTSLSTLSRRLVTLKMMNTKTPAAILVAEGHRLAGMGKISATDLEGDRLLTFNPPGTPYTDMIVASLAAAGARVEPVESSVVGSSRQMMIRELEKQDAVSLVAATEQVPSGAEQLELKEPVSLPLVLIWPVARRGAVVERLIEALSSP